MRIALWDIAAPLKDRLRPMVDVSDVFVDVPEVPATPVDVDVVIASRFAAKDAARARYRLLQAPGAGTDKIALDAVDPSAWLCNAYEHEAPIAEYVFAAILDHVVGYSAMTQRIREQGWTTAYLTRPVHGEAGGKVLGLVGLGHIGAAVAHRAKAFDMRVMAITASRRAGAANVDWLETADRLDEMLANADFVVLACPLTEQTRGMIAMPQFRRMKNTALVINVARAEVMHEEDLFRALSDGIIGGAVIDAWYRYPTSRDDPVSPAHFPFETLPNVRMTPHSAAWTDEVWQRRCKVFADNIARLRAGQALINVVRAPTGESRRAAG